MKIKLIEKNIGSIIDDFYFDFFKTHFKKMYNEYEDHSNEYLIFLNNMKKSMFIAGGSIANMLLNKDAKDFDIFIEDEKIRRFIIDYCLLIGYELCNNYDNDLKYSNKFGCFYKIKDENKCLKIKEFDEFNELYEADEFYNISFYYEFDFCKEFYGKYNKLIFTKNAITINCGKNVFQFIINKTFDRKKLFSYFDFIHTINYFNLDTNKLIIDDKSFDSIINKELCYLHSQYPIISLIRLRRFEKQGWAINELDLFKICNDILKIKLMTKTDYINAFCGCSNLTYIEIIKILDSYDFRNEIDFNDFIKKAEEVILNK